jgi:hypothetical protein
VASSSSSLSQCVQSGNGASLPRSSSTLSLRSEQEQDLDALVRKNAFLFFVSGCPGSLETWHRSAPPPRRKKEKIKTKVGPVFALMCAIDASHDAHITPHRVGLAISPRRFRLLTRCPHAARMSQVRRHVARAQLVSRAGAELAFRLPKDAAHKCVPLVPA